MSAVQVSAVIPAHNARETVARAVASALAQSRPPDEIVVVDDGSTDDTPGVVEGLGAGVRLVRQSQSGPSGARNAGVAAARGEWIAFLDADDEWHRDKLARQLELVAPGTALVATDWTRYLVTSSPPPGIATTQITSRDLLILNRFQTSTVLLRRDAFSAAGGFDPTLDGVEDWDMWLRASAHGRVVKLDWPFVRYTDTAQGYSKTLERVYRTGRAMLDRRLGPSPDRDGRAILAWHHLRFAVAFALDGDRAAARGCLRDLRRSGLVAAAPEGALRFLAPFLGRRLLRRAHGALGAGGAPAGPTDKAAALR